MSIYQTRTLKSGVWQCLDYQDAQTPKILSEFGLDAITIDILCAEDTRPRYFEHGQGFVFILRGVNLNPGAEPDDMISLRVYIDDCNLITLYRRELKAISTQRVDNTTNSWDCFWQLVGKMADNILEVSSDISDRSIEMEEKVVDADNLRDFDLRSDLGELRRQIVSMQRYLLPEQKMFVDFAKNNQQFSEVVLREVVNKFTKTLEDLDYSNNHTIVSHEELTSKMSLSMNKIIYVISIFTMILLPLNVLTSLLGINVAGIPYAESPYAFAVVCSILLLILVFLVYIIKKIRWI